VWEHAGVTTGIGTLPVTAGVLEGQVNFGSGTVSIANDHTFGPVAQKTASSNGSIVVPDNAVFDFTDVVTITMWFRGTNNAGDQIPFSKGINSGVSTMQWAFDTSTAGGTGHPAFGITSDGTTTFLPTVTDKNYYDGVWHFIAGVYDGTNVWCYADVLSKANIAHSGPMFTNTRQITMLVDDLGNNSFVGQVAEVRIYHEAKTQLQLWEMYDPRTRWDLYQPAGTRVFSFGQVSVPAADFRRTLSRLGTGIGHRQMVVE
jgi:hypothetical protein